MTKVQLKIARALTKQLTQGGDVIDEDKLIEILSYSFKKDPDWRRGSKNEIARAQPEGLSFVEDFLPKARKAFDYAISGAFDKACDMLQLAANAEPDTRTQGFILCQLAEMTYHRDQLEALRILARASALNPAIIKPIEGLEYKRISAPENQAVASCKFMNRFVSADDLILWLKDLESDLSFNPQTTKRFESALKDVGLWLGFGSHRPEGETGKGPDNLWAVGNRCYYVIECKSGAISNDISKADLNQLAGSVHWFTEKYPPDTNCIPIIIHQKNSCVMEATPHANARVIDHASMTLLLEKLTLFAKAVATAGCLDNPTEVRGRLSYFGLTESQFLTNFSKNIRKRS